MAQIASLGKNGKWESADHDLFLRSWTQVQDREPRDLGAGLTDSTEAIEITPSQRALILRKTKVAIAGKSVEDLEVHLDW